MRRDLLTYSVFIIIVAIPILLILYGIGSIWRRSSVMPGRSTRLNVGAFTEAFVKSRLVDEDSAVIAGIIYILAGLGILLLYLLTFIVLR